METVAKFSVFTITDGEYPTSEGNKKVKNISMGAVYDSDPESENGKFFASTPSVSCSLGIVNEAAAEVFGQAGDEILVTFRNLSAEKREVEEGSGKEGIK